MADCSRIQIEFTRNELARNIDLLKQYQDALNRTRSWALIFSRSSSWAGARTSNSSRNHLLVCPLKPFLVQPSHLHALGWHKYVLDQGTASWTPWPIRPTPNAADL